MVTKLFLPTVQYEASATKCSGQLRCRQAQCHSFTLLIVHNTLETIHVSTQKPIYKDNSKHQTIHHTQFCQLFLKLSVCHHSRLPSGISVRHIEIFTIYSAVRKRINRFQLHTANLHHSRSQNNLPTHYSNSISHKHNTNCSTHGTQSDTRRRGNKESLTPLKRHR